MAFFAIRGVGLVVQVRDHFVEVILEFRFVFFGTGETWQIIFTNLLVRAQWRLRRYIYDFRKLLILGLAAWLYLFGLLGQTRFRVLVLLLLYCLAGLIGQTMAQG